MGERTTKFNPTEILDLWGKADCVVLDRGDGSPLFVAKGEPGAGGSKLEIKVQNRTEIEVFTAAALLRDRGELDDRAMRNCRELLRIAGNAVLPQENEGVAFAAALIHYLYLDRSEGGPEGAVGGGR